jgi:phospholipase/lecithinase/hemolysin
MNPIFSRTLKALCAVVVAGVLVACGSSSTVDPFKPTRVIGLGDGYNVTTATVRVTGSTTGTVVGQVAAYFGQTNIVYQASAGAKVANLAAQIDALTGLNSGDLVVITVGTFDVKEGTNATTAAAALVTQVQRLLNAGVTHVLIMPVLEVSRTPWGRANSFDPTATPTASLTNTFNTAVNLAISNAFGGSTPNRVIYAGSSNVAPTFLTATSSATYSPFTDTGYSSTVAAGTTPACGDATLFTGCDESVPTAASRPYTTMLFADGIHLTPAGNSWVAQFLYASTAYGWR